MKKLSLRIDAKLPDALLARAAVLAMLVVGGLVAVSVPIFLGLVLRGLLFPGH